MRACAHPDCDGVVEADGFCDTCGRPAAPAPAAAAPAPTGSAPDADGPRTGPLGLSPGSPSSAGSHSSAGSPSSPAFRSSSGPVSASGRVPSGRTSSSASRSTAGRQRIGDGLVEIGAAPEEDPADAVLRDPSVPERNRYCAACDAPVGRSRGERPGRAEGFCPSCGAPFSFLPGLEPGTMVADQYEVLGALAHGGLGWVYLARDRKVNGRWVVLKGMIHAGDASTRAVIEAEQAFLALLVHPRIVRIYNVVSAPAAPGAPATTYLVMEYVTGRSLRQMRDPRTPMPPDQALAYVLEVLPALSHMHDRELLYCDFKPDNVVQSGTEVKLIDLGAVRRLTDPGGDVWGTVGYQAPEITPTGAGPSVSSDIYTVGRTLAVLVANFDFSRTLRDRLPDAADAPALAEHEPLERLLRTATRPDPAARFASVDELADQLTGVLRQVVAVTGGSPPPRLSPVFGPPRGVAGTAVDTPPAAEELAAVLPVPLLDPADAATPALTAAENEGPHQVLALAHLDTDQARYSAVLAHLALGDVDAAVRGCRAHRVPGSWRWAWAALLVGLAGGDLAAAREAAEAVLDAVPGELAPQLAAAVLDEHAGAPEAAGRRYHRIWCTDRSWVAAAFGLARVRDGRGDRAGALAALDEVPAASAQRAQAAVAAVRLLLDGADDLAPVLDAGERSAAVELDPLRRAELECEILEAARAVTDTRPRADVALLELRVTPEAVGLGLERRYRERARYARSRAERFALVDRANDVRPWTRR